MIAVIDVAVGQPQHLHRTGQPRFGQRLQTGTAGPAHHHVLFHRHEGLVGGGQLSDQVGIDGLDEAHVHHGGIQRLARRHGRGDHRTKGQNGNAPALPAHLPPAQRQFREGLLHRHPRPGTTRIAHRHGALVLHGRIQHLPALVFVGRCHHHHVGHAAQEGVVVHAGMRGPVGAHQTGPVQRKHHRQVLQRHVVQQLVVRPLQEGGIDGHHRHQPVAGHAGRKGHGVLLGNAHVEIARGKTLLERHQPRPLAHGRRDRHQPWFGLAHVADPVGEHLGVGGLFGRRGRRLDAFGRVELARPVVEDGIGLGQLVALPLAGDDVQKHRSADLAQVLQRGNECIEVVPIDRAEVGEAQLLEQRGRHQHALGVLFQLAGQLVHGRHHRQHLAGHVTCLHDRPGRQRARQIVVHRPHGRRDRHVVVVQDDQQVHVPHHAGIVERLEGHAGAHGTIADHRHVAPAAGPLVLAQVARGHRHAQRRRNRGGRMRGAEGVVLALAAPRKARQALILPQRGHLVAPAGEDLVRIGLMAHVPDQPVMRGVEHIVQRDGQFHRTQIGRQVPPGTRHGVQNELPQLVGQLGQLLPLQRAQVGRTVDTGQQRFGRGFNVFGHDLAEVSDLYDCRTISAAARR